MAKHVLSCVVIVAIHVVAFLAGNSYITNFPFSENPISEGGKWINGGTVGLDWSNVRTTPGLVFGTQTGIFSNYNDSVALLSGSWGPDQTVEATVHSVNQSLAYFEEVELWLHGSISAHSITGYEINFRCTGTLNNGYTQIVRWNGPLNNFTYLDANVISGFAGVKDGDIVKAAITGSIITVWVNGIQVAQAADSTYPSGNPGMGFYLQDATGVNSDFGFTSYQATSGQPVLPPSVPTNLFATAVSASQINLSWTASIASVNPVAGYRVFRDGLPLGTTADTSYFDMGLSPSTMYTYTVAAYDSTGSSSVQSTAASATTLGQAGSSWVHVQTGARNSGAASNALAFSSPTGAGNLIIVEVDWTGGLNFVSISDSQGNVYKQVGTEQSSSSVGVQSRLYYAANILGGADTVTTAVSGTPAYHEIFLHEYSGLDPIAPLDAFAVNVAPGTTFTSGTIATTASHDLLYGIETDSSQASAAAGWTTRSTLDGNVAADRDAPSPGNYAFTGNSAGAFIAWAVAFKQPGWTVPPPDTTAPSVPTGLSAIAISASQINLSWTASADPDDSPSQITYHVFRNGATIGSTTTGVTTYQDTGLIPGTSYSYSVSATDPAGNTSAPSATVQVTTQGLPVVISSFTASPGSITAGLSATLSWSVSNATSLSIDNGVGDVTGRTSTAVSPASNVTYTLTATNSNEPPTAQATTAQATVVVTPDTQAPSVPAGVTATSPFSSQVNVSWNPSTDNVAVTGYKIFRNSVQVGTASTTAYSDSGLAANTGYTYTVAAYDAAGNTSAPSAVTSITTGPASQTYTTSFPFVENPISEGGNWINGGIVGSDWSNVRTTPGLAFGTQTGIFSNYNDSVALLSGSWGPDQTVEATVHSVNQSLAYFEEVELWLHGSISAHSITGYEINFRCTGTLNSGYMQIVRWDGTLNNLTGLYINSGFAGVKDGDIVKATITGSIITVWVNGIQVGQVTDSTFATGNPGMGFYLQDVTGLNADYGFTSFTASDGIVSIKKRPGQLISN